MLVTRRFYWHGPMLAVTAHGFARCAGPPAILVKARASGAKPD